jgi:hypothetical protein
MEAAARQIVETHYTAFPFHLAGDTTLSRLIDTRVAQMQITRDVIQRVIPMCTSYVDEQLTTMRKISRALERTNFDAYVSAMQAEFNYAFDQSKREGEIDEVLCGYIMNAQNRTPYEQGWFGPLLTAVQSEIVERRREITNVTGLERRGQGGRGGGTQGRGRGPPRRGGGGAWGQGDSSSQSSQKSGETYQSGDSRTQNYKRRPVEGIEEDTSDESDAESDEYNTHYVRCIDEQVAFKNMEHEKREQQEAIALRAHVDMIMLMDIYTSGQVYITGHEHSFMALNMSTGPFLRPCDTCARDHDVDARSRCGPSRQATSQKKSSNI